MLSNCFLEIEIQIKTLFSNRTSRGDCRQTQFPNATSERVKTVEVRAESISIDDILFIKQLFTQSDKLEKFVYQSGSTPSRSEIENALGPSDMDMQLIQERKSIHHSEYGLYHIERLFETLISHI
uniref:Uncharacterized protein n=1 Tax=Caenorhabditis tropicalis TaxID=1561998 RepID=A0A1I7TRX8_9PELO